MKNFLYLVFILLLMTSAAWAPEAAEALLKGFALIVLAIFY